MLSSRQRWLIARSDDGCHALSNTPLVSLPYPTLHLHVCSLGYQKLCRRRPSILTRQVQRRPVALNPTKCEGERNCSREVGMKEVR